MEEQPPLTEEEVGSLLAAVEAVMGLGDVRAMFRLWDRVASRLGVDVPAVGV